jgi:hypothetical protein
LIFNNLTGGKHRMLPALQLLSSSFLMNLFHPSFCRLSALAAWRELLFLSSFPLSFFGPFRMPPQPPAAVAIQIDTTRLSLQHGWQTVIPGAPLLVIRNLP